MRVDARPQRRREPWAPTLAKRVVRRLAQRQQQGDFGDRAPIFGVSDPPRPPPVWRCGRGTSRCGRRPYRLNDRRSRKPGQHPRGKASRGDRQLRRADPATARAGKERSVRTLVPQQIADAEACKPLQQFGCSAALRRKLPSTIRSPARSASQVHLTVHRRWFADAPQSLGQRCTKVAADPRHIRGN